MFENRHETLHKCTGVHSAVLCTEGMVDFFMWIKEENAVTIFPAMPETPVWGPLVLSLDPSRDIILFPSEDSLVSSDVNWHPSMTTAAGTGRYRLVVLEATWNHAKGLLSI